MPQSLLKKEFCNIPVKVETSWRDNIQNKADRLHISRNAAFNLIVAFGAPLVEAHLQLMEKTLKENCRRIAAGKSKLKKVFRTRL